MNIREEAEMNHEKYKLGQEVALYGRIESIDIEDVRDIEHTTCLVIDTRTKRIRVNPKYENVITDPKPRKPVVPQYVADWYEGNNGDLNGALFTMIRLWDEKSRNSDFYRWFRTNKEAFQILVNMHQYGYEVEVEKRYTVEIPNPKGPKGLTFCLSRLYNGKIVMSCAYNKDWRNIEIMQLTEQEIREDFDWAWQWAKEVD